VNRIDDAFKRVNRKDFLPSNVAENWRRDAPLPIGHDQTNSQPYVVGLMLEWLDAQSGDKVLDVGSGSGWTTALLAHIVGREGRVFAVERIPELLNLGHENCKKAGINSSKGRTRATVELGKKGNIAQKNGKDIGSVTFYQAGKELGLPSEAPFDRILVSATSEELPKELLKQMKIGAKLVIPILDEIQEITRIGEDDYERINHSGFMFVPLVKEY